MFIHTNLVLIFTQKLINNNVVVCVKTIKIEGRPIRNVDKFFLRLIQKIKTLDHVNFVFILQTMNANSLVAYHIFLSKHKVITFKLMSEFGVEKMKDIVIHHSHLILIFLKNEKELLSYEHICPFFRTVDKLPEPFSDLFETFF